MAKSKKELIAFDTLIQSPQLSRMTVANIAKQTGKTKRGVKATLTRRGLKIADYDGRSAEEQWADFGLDNDGCGLDVGFVLWWFVAFPILLFLGIYYEWMKLSTWY